MLTKQEEMGFQWKECCYYSILLGAGIKYSDFKQLKRGKHFNLQLDSITKLSERRNSKGRYQTEHFLLVHFKIHG